MNFETSTSTLIRKKLSISCFIALANISFVVVSDIVLCKVFRISLTLVLKSSCVKSLLHKAFISVGEKIAV